MSKNVKLVKNMEIGDEQAELETQQVEMDQTRVETLANIEEASKKSDIYIRGRIKQDVSCQARYRANRPFAKNWQDYIVDAVDLQILKTDPYLDIELIKLSEA